MEQGWIDLGKNFVESILYIGITILTTFAIVYIKKYANILIEKVGCDDAKEYIKLAEQTVIDVVLATNQTFVNVKKAEGTFDREAWVTAFEKTKGDILAILTEAQRQAIEKVYGDLDKWLETKIEATVLEVKPGQVANV